MLDRTVTYQVLTQTGRPGDTVLAEVAVADIDFTKRRVQLTCQCSVRDVVVLKGEATVLAPSKKFD